MEYKDSSRKIGILYGCKITYINYICRDGKILKEIKSILEKKFESEIEKSKLKAKDILIAGRIGLIALVGLVFPPIEIAT